MTTGRINQITIISEAVLQPKPQPHDQVIKQVNHFSLPTSKKHRPSAVRTPRRSPLL